MILLQASSLEEVELVLKDPEIFDRISCDGQKVEDYHPSMDDKSLYLMIWEKNCIIGLYHLTVINPATLEIHCNILKDYRDKAGEAGKLLFGWILDACHENYQKFIAEIPFTYPQVYHYTKKFGFKDEGTNRLSIMKNGELVDQWRVGITRNEVESWVP